MILAFLLLLVPYAELVCGNEDPRGETLEGKNWNKLDKTLSLMRSQVNSTNMYVQDIRISLKSVTTRMDQLEQALEKVEQSVAEKILKLEETVLGLLKAMETAQKSGVLIPAVKVEQSSTFPGLPVGPEKAVDGHLATQSHTTCTLPRQWFKYHFSQRQAVGQIMVVNGKMNVHKDRLNGMRVSVMVDNLNRLPCRVDTVEVREGDTFEAQTYYLDCSGNTGVGVEFVLDTTNCLEFREIAVYSP